MAQLSMHAGAGHERYYGNTQAVVLRNFNGPRLRMIADTLERNDYSIKRPATCRPAYIALHKYSGYKVLFGERMYAANYPDHKSTGNMFMDLPGELRNKIYALFLIIEPAIEMSPKSSEHRDRTIMYVYQRSVKRYVKLKPILRLLRLSRTINKEASDVFYGENVFRFTNTDGWHILQAFFDNIGVANVGRLRHIAVPVPWEWEPHSGWANGAERLMKRRGLLAESATLPVFPMSRCLSTLAEVGKLTRLDITLPFDFEVLSFKGLPLKLSKMPGLKIKLVHLRGDCEAEAMHNSQRPMTRMVVDEDGQEFGEVFSGPRGFAAEQGWEYEAVWFDSMGRYPVVVHGYDDYGVMVERGAA